MTPNTKTDEKTDAKLDKLIGKVAEATREADLPRQWCLDNQNRLVRFASALLAADGNAPRDVQDAALSLDDIAAQSCEACAPSDYGMQKRAFV